jgi:type VI secretion system protein ImpL
MVTLLKSRLLLVGLGLTMIALFIWYAGPYFAFGTLQPLLPEFNRIVAIVLVVAIWAASLLLKRLRATRASDRLVAAVVKQSQSQPQPTADQIALRERFEEAVATLKQSRRGRASLYELPWYVIIGAPGSGKTTALVNSGLHFPLEQRTGKGALRGIGGTRNCDWWFTDEAVFLDTAGRYTTQDSDAAADKEGWTEFLALLKKYRKRRPVNGVILTISAQDLLIQGPRDREAHVAAARRRLDELNRDLRIRIPVYLMVTKCDLVSGFTEYFDDLEKDGRAQVWGVTFPYEQTSTGQAAQAFVGEFDTLMTRLNERLFARVDQDRDVGRRTRIFAFPQQMTALREALSHFVSEVFGSTRFDRQILLRGVYFTSGTQEGTPIDRLLGSIGRRFAVAPQAMAAPPGRGKAYFIEKFLKEILLAESGLAGVNRRLEMQKAALQLGAYAAMVLIAVLGVTLLTVSYRRNQAYIADVDAAVNEFRRRPRLPAATLEAVVPRLDAVRAVVDVAAKYEEDTPLAMRWGLYQGSALGRAAQAAYARELDGALLSAMAERFRQRLLQYASEPIAVFEYLKAYLMLGDPERLQKDQLAVLADIEWEEAFSANPAARESLSRHFRSLLEHEDGLRAVPIDQRVVEQARAALGKGASVPHIIYSQLKLAYPGSVPGSLQLDIAAGLGADQVIRRKSGARLSEPIPALYTKPVFLEIAGRDADALVSQYTTDSWVWGDTVLSIADKAQLKVDVLELYEQDYIEAWQKVLDDVEVVPFPNVAQATRVLAIVAGTASPLRGLLRVITDNTTLVAPAAPQAGGSESAADAVRRRIEGVLRRGQEIAGIPTVQPGAKVTAHFARIHQLLAGDAGTSPLDGVLARINDIQMQLRSVGADLGGTPPAEALAKSGRTEAVKALQQEAETLPPVVGDLVTQIGGRAEAIVLREGGSNLTRLYVTEVARDCQALIGGKYPFDAGPTEVQIADFGQVFGHGGLFDTFFKQHLQALVDTTSSEWTWRTATSGASVGVGLGMLRQFQAAERIREMFFATPSMMPEVGFRITPITMDPTVTKFRLRIDGQPMEYQFGPLRTTSMKWPGPMAGPAEALFETRAGNRTIANQEGPWALFRMLDAIRVQPESGTRFTLHFESGGAIASMQLDADRARNPFGPQAFQQFRCG